MSRLTGSSIPNVTIEAIARSLFKEAINYGFKQIDLLRFVNIMLDMSFRNGDYSITVDKDILIYDRKKEMALPLIGDRVKVRACFKKEDKPLFEKWFSDSDGRHFLISRITAKTTDLDVLLKSDDNILGVITLNDNVHNNGEIPIGLLAFFDYDRIQRKAELRKLIGEPEHRGKGLAKEATKLWIQFGISALGLKKIYLNTLETNIRNIKLNEELGFKVEGILRNECFFDGKYHDVLKMSYLIE